MSGKAIRETLGVLAVVAGLVFVGMEIRQNNVIARGEARQALADRSVDMFLSRATNEDLALQVNTLSQSDEGSIDCSVQFATGCAYVFALIRHHENVFIQVRDGVADESVFQTYGFGSSSMYRRAWFRDMWAERRGQYDPDFVAAFEAGNDLAP